MSKAPVLDVGYSPSTNLDVLAKAQGSLPKLNLDLFAQIIERVRQADAGDYPPSGEENLVRVFLFLNGLTYSLLINEDEEGQVYYSAFCNELGIVGDSYEKDFGEAFNVMIDALVSTFSEETASGVASILKNSERDIKDIAGIAQKYCKEVEERGPIPLDYLIKLATAA